LDTACDASAPWRKESAGRLTNRTDANSEGQGTGGKRGGISAAPGSTATITLITVALCSAPSMLSAERFDLAFARLPALRARPRSAQPAST
jgi:hypothetical protein